MAFAQQQHLECPHTDDDGSDALYGPVLASSWAGTRRTVQQRRRLAEKKRPVLPKRWHHSLPERFGARFAPRQRRRRHTFDLFARPGSEGLSDDEPDEPAKPTLLCRDAAIIPFDDAYAAWDDDCSPHSVSRDWAATLADLACDAIPSPKKHHLLHRRNRSEKVYLVGLQRLVDNDEPRTSLYEPAWCCGITG